MKETYRDFIRFALDDIKSIPDNCDKIDWQDFFLFCERHGIMGIVFHGLERSNKKIPSEILYEWIGAVESIKSQNIVTNKRLLAVVKWWKTKGYKSVILKGQANGLMYPMPELRTPGDIDIWVNGEKRGIINEVLKECPDAHYSIHHVNMTVFEDVSVEVHYRPIYLINWFIDRKLQKYINTVLDIQFGNYVQFERTRIGCLTDDFNVVYQILHMYAHFFSTRNNFKQFVDYYYLLKKRLPVENKERVVTLLKEFKVLKYARGIMWIMKEVLGLDPELIVVESNEKIGRAILKESMHYGTFSTNKLVYVIQRFVANIRLSLLFPSQVLISPWFLLWHQWWKKRMKLALK